MGEKDVEFGRKDFATCKIGRAISQDFVHIMFQKGDCDADALKWYKDETGNDTEN